MARKVHLDTGYIFVPSANRITIDKAIPQEKLLLITNLNSNTVIYNFSDPNLKVSSYTRTRDTQIAVTGTAGGTSVTNLWPSITPIVGQRISGYGIPSGTYITAVSGTTLTLSQAITTDPYQASNTLCTLYGTVIVLNYNTSSMTSTDKLQIFVDEYEETIRPAEVFMDPVGKQRVSQPEALIDTDFEYGLQPTKWESLQLISNRPSYYTNPTTPITLLDIQRTNGSKVATITARTRLTGTLTTTTASTTVTGFNTSFLTELKTGTLLYSNAGAFIGAISTVVSDTSATLKRNGVTAITTATADITGGRFFDDGAPGAGIFSPTGTITTSVSTSVTGSGTSFLTEISVGDALFGETGTYLGRVASIASNTALTLTANALASQTTLTFSVSQYSAGTPIYVQLTTEASANGSYLLTGPTAPANVGAATAVTYDTEAAASVTGSIFDADTTIAYPGKFFTAQNLFGATYATDNVAPASTITVTTTSHHGLAPGNTIFVSGTSQTAVNGNRVVSRILNPTQFQFVIDSQLATAPTGGQLFVRPTGQVIHRPFDGGIKITAGTNSPNNQIIRQSRRYFRYQSGKGMQFSTGTILKPSINPDNITVTSSRVTVTCKEPHYLLPGASVTVSGCTNTGAGSFNGVFTVSPVGLTDTTFTYTSEGSFTVPSANQTAGGFPFNVSVTSWTGAEVRVGMFDNQNGFFFKHDGTKTYVVRRSSTDQLTGTVRCTNGSGVVTGIGTIFSRQLKPGDNVVIRGQSYRVLTITSDTAMNVSPEYRGTTINSPNSVFFSKTVDYEVDQLDWNIDTCDGRGPSGFNLDLQRMQMFYIDYSWYGAGAIRFGFKDQRGEVIYVNRIAHANTKTEAYMRSGNLPARYETNTLPPTTILSSTLSSGTGGGGTISVQDTSKFPNSGNLWIQNPTGSGGTATHELVTYTAKSATGFTIGSRALAGGAVTGFTVTAGSNAVTTTSSVASVMPFQYVINTTTLSSIPAGTYVVGVVTGSPNTIYLSNNATSSGATQTLNFVPFGAAAAVTHTYSATAPIAVSYYNPQYAPNISHWGSSVIMDGRYDEDKSLIFTAGMRTTIQVPIGATSALISLRIAPSVDSGLTGLLGVKELINRMQLVLNSSGVMSDGRFLIDIRLNGQVSAGRWQKQGGSSLAEVCYHTTGTTISGGESILSFFTNTAGGNNFTTTTADLLSARDLGNSILGGGTSTNVNTSYYPDGPDIVTVVARNIDSTAKNVNARLSWTEAQA